MTHSDHHNLLTRIVAVLGENTTDDVICTPHTDAAVLVAITDEAHPKVLLTRRACKLKNHAGEVSFVGGKRDEEDESNTATALREAFEEVALPPDAITIIGQLQSQESASGMSVTPIVAIINTEVELQANDDEIAKILWMDLAWLVSAPTTDYIFTKQLGEQTLNIVTPSWRVDDEVVWGLTGRILADFLQRVFARKVDWYYRLAD